MKKLVENLQVLYQKEIDNNNFGVANQSSKTRKGRDKLIRNKSYENKKWGLGRTKEEIANAISFGIYKLKSQNVFTPRSLRC
jgi:hypothetical protein